MKYIQVSIAEMRANKWPGHEMLCSPEWAECEEWDSAIYLCDDNDIPIKLIGSDGGEPEDQSMRKDWAWVVEALNEAFQRGYTQRVNDEFR